MRNKIIAILMTLVCVVTLIPVGVNAAAGNMTREFFDRSETIRGTRGSTTVSYHIYTINGTGSGRDNAPCTIQTSHAGTLSVDSYIWWNNSANYDHASVLAREAMTATATAYAANQAANECTGVFTYASTDGYGEISRTYHAFF